MAIKNSILEIRIHYEDTDCGGVVYYANYLRYFERARTHFLEAHGLDVVAMIRGGTQFMVAHADVTYRSPARYGETLLISTWLEDGGRAALTFAHRLVESVTDRLVAEGSATLAAVDLEGKLKRLPLPLFSLWQEQAVKKARNADADSRQRTDHRIGRRY